MRRWMRVASLLLRSRGPGGEALLYFAMAGAFCEAPRTIAANHVAPEGDRSGMAHIFNDFPVAREAVENQRRCVAADTRTPKRHSDKELRHPVVGGLLTGHGDARPRDQGKTHRVRSLENEQRVRVIVGKPVGEDFIFVRVVCAEDGMETGIE